MANYTPSKKYEIRTHEFDHTHAKYTLNEYVEVVEGRTVTCDLHINEKDSELLTQTWIAVEPDIDPWAIILKTEKKLALLKLLDEFTQEMEGYSYYSSNLGISVSDYEDIADRILSKFLLE